MDAHRLRSIIDLLVDEHRRLEIGDKLARIQQTLDASASNPSAAADEQFRGALTALLAALRETRANDLVESERRILNRIGADRFCGSGLAERVLEIANERPFLPARAKAAFCALAKEIGDFVEGLSQTQAGLEKLQVEPLQRRDDAWELGILFPQRLIEGDLRKLFAELEEWGEILKDFLPLFAAAPVWVSLRAYSTERFELMAPLDRDAALALGLALARIYQMFDKVSANRDRAGDLERDGYPSEIVSRLTGYEQQLIGRHLREIKEELAKRHVRKGAARPKELDRRLEKGLRFMAIRVREGVELEIAGPASGPEAAGADAGAEPVSHHVRAALLQARQARPEPAERQAPRIPLSKIAEAPESDKKAA